MKEKFTVQVDFLGFIISRQHNQKYYGGAQNVLQFSAIVQHDLLKP